MVTPVAFSFGGVQVLHFPMLQERVSLSVCLYSMLPRADMLSCGSGLTILGLAHALPMTLDRFGRVPPHDKAEDTASSQKHVG